MPANVVKPGQEKYWDRAKERAAEQGHKENWAYVNAIFQTMVGNKSAHLRVAMRWLGASQSPGSLPSIGARVTNIDSTNFENDPYNYADINFDDGHSVTVEVFGDIRPQIESGLIQPVGASAAKVAFIMNPLSKLLALFRAAHQAEWTAHWTVENNAFYGDHLMLERLYGAFPDEIDGMAEKIVKTFGAEGVNLPAQLALMARLVNRWEAEPDLIRRVNNIESDIQTAIVNVRAAMKAQDQLSVGLDNFLAGLADSHETPLYLLGQRQKASKTASKMSWRVAARFIKADLDNDIHDLNVKVDDLKDDIVELKDELDGELKSVKHDLKSVKDDFTSEDEGIREDISRLWGRIR